MPNLPSSVALQLGTARQRHKLAAVASEVVGIRGDVAVAGTVAVSSRRAGRDNHRGVRWMPALAD
jgi:hypothetical protein